MTTFFEKFVEDVCTACGFNMLGYYPKRCRFCGATSEHFLTIEECYTKYRVRSTAISDRITQLRSFPQLGYEHAAYRIDTGDAVVWIDHSIAQSVLSGK